MTKKLDEKKTRDFTNKYKAYYNFKLPSNKTRHIEISSIISTFNGDISYHLDIDIDIAIAYISIFNQETKKWQE